MPLAPLAGASARQREAHASAQAGNLAMVSHDYASAEKYYREALSHDPNSTVARLNLCTTLIILDRHASADSMLQQILSDDPGNARALELLGESAFQRGRLEEAIAIWEKTAALAPESRLDERIAKARRLLHAEDGFQRADAAHFSLRFDGGEASDDLAREVLDYLDQTWSMLAGRLSHYPENVIQVTLYSSRAFHEATESPDWVGGLFDGQIRIPIRGLNHLTPEAKRVLTHELTHAFVTSRSRGNAPQWIQEGIAQVMEGRTTRADRAAFHQAWVTLGGMPWASEFTYPKALSQIEFLFSTWSESHMNDILDRLGRGAGLDAAFTAAIGLRYEEFLSAWGEWLSR